MSFNAKELKEKYNPDGSVTYKMQQRMLDLLKVIDAICRKHNMQYWLSGGTMLGFGLVSTEFISVTITDKWLPAAKLIKILCVGGAVMPLHTALSYMVITKGRSDINFWCTIGLGLVEMLIMITIWQLGITTMVVAYTSINVAWVLVWHFFVRRLTGYSLLHRYR
jgi:O-antigen/teichoic acid export membrane protein